MCGRYLTPAEADLERAWGLSAPRGYSRSYNFAPSRIAPVVRRGPDAAWRLDGCKWGFQPHWAKRSWINARSETVFTTRAFAAAARQHRCLVPAVGWYEWQGEKPPRQPWLFHRDGFAPFAFAGIWTPGEPATFAILTTAAAPAHAGIHDRMPLVLEESDYARWVADDADRDELGAVIGNNRVDFAVYKVSDYVNKPANDDAECLRPLD